jgi:hypothetical protein
MTRDVNNNEDVLDSRDIISRIEELESDIELVYDDYKESFQEEYDKLVENKEIDESETDFDEWIEERIPSFEDWLEDPANNPGFNEWLVENECSADSDELIVLKKVAEQGEGYGDWNSGETLIRESYFTEYTEEFCKDVGDVPRELPDWIVIDWEATAENLKDDYTEIDFDGVTYYMRA